MMGGSEGRGPSITLSLLDRYQKVPDRSGLNWWNAGGRVRNVDEVYIPMPQRLGATAEAVFGSKVAGTRFHARLASTDEWITLRLEGTANAETRQAKQIASDGNTKRLGYWMLRDSLQLPVRHVVTVEDLRTYGRTTVTFTRVGTNPQTGWAMVQTEF